MLNKLTTFYTGIQSYLMIGLGLACILSSSFWYITHLKLETEVATHKADIESYKAESARTELVYKNYKETKEKEYRDKAKKADEAASALTAQYRASVLRYQAAQRKAVGTGTVSTSLGNPEGGDRPGSSTVLPSGSITIPTEDGLICADNTARLQAVHDWAVDLNK